MPLELCLCHFIGPLSNSLDTQENFEGQAAQTEAQCLSADAEQDARAHTGHVLRVSGCLVKMIPQHQVQLTDSDPES